MLRSFSIAWLCTAALSAAAASSGAAAVTITDTAIVVAPATLVINGSGLAAGTAIVTLGQYPPLVIDTQTDAQVTALLPAGATLQGT